MVWAGSQEEAWAHGVCVRSVCACASGLRKRPMEEETGEERRRDRRRRTRRAGGSVWELVAAAGVRSQEVGQDWGTGNGWFWGARRQCHLEVGETAGKRAGRWEVAGRQGWWDRRWVIRD